MNVSTHSPIIASLRSHQSVTRLLSLALLLVVLCLSLLGTTLRSAIQGTFAASSCTASSPVYAVVRGDTLGLIGLRYHTSWQALQGANHIPNANLIYVAQRICIPSSSSSATPLMLTNSVHIVVQRSPFVAHGTSNPFPYPSCTWWASQRFYQLHGFYVPWTTQSMAWQWTARAYQFGWHVSSSPTVGAIVDLQPWVQGAYGGGHVAVVERVLSNGHIIASNTNWGAYPYSVTYTDLVPAWGVTFITA